MATVMFKVRYGEPSPIKVEAEIPKWPNYDADNEQIFENTHFLTIEEAWPKLLSEHESGLWLESCAVIDAQSKLSAAKERMVDAGLKRHRAIEAHKSWLAGERP